MGILDNYRIKQSIATLLSSNNPTSQEVAQAVARLKQIGRPTIPKLIDALGKTRDQEPIVTILVGLLDNETLPVFVAALTNFSPRVVTGVVEALSCSDTYDPHRLLNLFANQKISREHLEKILVHRKHRLQPDALLRLLTTIGKGDHAVVFRLLSQVATKDIIPELIHRLRTEDWTMRSHIARMLSRFRTSAVRDTLVKLLTDAHKNVRLVALNGLTAMHVTFDMGPLCLLLRDPDATVQRKAVEIVLESIQDGTEETQKRVVQGLSALGDTRVIKELLGALQGKDCLVVTRIVAALSTHGGATIVQAVLMLLTDQNTFVRQCALEILHTMKDERALRALVEALKDKEIRERTVEALTALGDKKMVPLFLRMLGRDSEADLIAIRILVALGEPQAIHPLLVQLQNPDVSIRREVLRALAVLTNEKYAPDVLQAVMAIRDSVDDDLRELANKMATTIIKRFGQKVLPRSELAQAAVAASQRVGNEMAAVISPASSWFETPSTGHPEPVDSVRRQETEVTLDITAIEPGVVFANRYRVIRRVGQGGFSTVFLVDDTMVHEDVILKVLNPQGTLDDSTIKRFIHELRYARMVTHENIIRIHDFISLGRSYAISMEYFPSHNLADELQEEVPLGIRRGLKIIWDICRGVGAAHQVNVVHRDLKPPNILINDNGVMKIVDFGVAAVASDMSTRLTRVGTLLGTPSYMAPEQVRCRDVDARTDIYSLGVIMYEVFTGKKPYTGDVMSVLFQHVEGRPIPPREVNSHIPPALEAIILEAMAVEPEARFQSIDALRKSLMAFSRQKH